MEAPYSVDVDTVSQVCVHTATFECTKLEILTIYTLYFYLSISTIYVILLLALNLLYINFTYLFQPFIHYFKLTINHLSILLAFSQFFQHFKFTLWLFITYFNYLFINYFK